MARWALRVGLAGGAFQNGDFKANAILNRWRG